MKSQVQLSDVKLYGSTPPPTDDPSCLGTITIPVRDHMNAATATALTHTDWSFIPNGRYINRNIIQGSILPLQRNAAVQRMLGDWLLFIDDDMVWDAYDVARLIQARDEMDADILGALCFRRSSPHQPTLFVREQATSGAYNYLEDWDTDVVEVDATGMAFVVIHKRVFEMIAQSPMPPFEERIASNPPEFFRWTGMFGEDLQFCQDAKSVGARIWVDTRIEIGHVSEIEIRHRQFMLELAQRDPAIYAERLRVNTEMGLPTISPQQALQKLGLT